MKKWITLCLCLFFTGITFGQNANENGQDSIKGYEIHGHISGNYAGKVYLVKEDGMHGNQTAIDSCEVRDGKFFFKGETAPEFSLIHFIKSHDGQLAPLFLEKGVTTINMRADYFLGAQPKGTVNNNLLNLHNLQVRYYLDSMLMATNTHWLRHGHGTYAEQDSLFKFRTREQNTKKLNMEKKMINQYSDEAFAPFILLFEMTSELTLDELKATVKKLEPNFPGHPYIKELKDVIVQKEFKVGSEAPAFTIRGMNGKDIELKDFAGKYVLIDFWASWCAPCRGEMPNIVKLYKECKGKNFEIIGISLDSKEAAWKKAVKELKMTWPQACDFQVWYGPVARSYNLSAVPYTVLINSEGKIEAIDLRGQQLINTVKRLVKNK